MQRRITLILFALIVGIMAPFAETRFFSSDVAVVDVSYGAETLLGNAMEQIAAEQEKQKNELREQLVAEVTEYINKVAPNSYEALPAYMVGSCLATGLDICFMMSQTQLETCFGTLGMGRAKSRYSMFGVSSRYSSYEECIDHYVALLFKSYLVKGRTEQDLLKKYVNGSGFRYAENPTYEIELSATYRDVVRKTNIKQLQQQYESI